MRSNGGEPGLRPLEEMAAELRERADTHRASRLGYVYSNSDADLDNRVANALVSAGVFLQAERSEAAPKSPTDEENDVLGRSCK